jgi:hypothetical protein
LYLLLAGAVLLVSIIAAISLTITLTETTKNQLLYSQLSRNIDNAMCLVRTSSSKN